MMYNQISTFPFKQIYAGDFEFYGDDGENPQVVCMVVQDLRTGDISRYWRDELLEMKTPPFITGGNTLLLTFFASAEIQSMLALNWPTNVIVIDLFAEFRCATNGNPDVGRKGLINALAYYQLDHLIPEQKDAMRALILSGGPWSEDQEQAILDYCTEDVVALAPLLGAMISSQPWTELRLNQAQLRGRYMKAVGMMQYTGIPIDKGLLEDLNANWDQIKTELIDSINVTFGTYTNGSFREALFEDYLARKGIAWPRLPSGRLALDKNTFSSMSKRNSSVRPLYELRKTLGEFKLNKLAVGSDSRNRTMLRPFSAKTGRNQPSTTKFAFGPAKWVRGLIKPELGSALAYCDWSSQEIAIAAALSGDELLWQAYASGDPYIAFAIQAGLAPPRSHKGNPQRCPQPLQICSSGYQLWHVCIWRGTSCPDT